MPKTFDQKNKPALFEELVKLLDDNDCLVDVCIYVDDRRYLSKNFPKKEGAVFDDDLNLWVQTGIDVLEYVEYANPDTLTLTFEGPLYHDINYGDAAMLDKIERLAKKYGLYPEMGYAWSMSLYEI